MAAKSVNNITKGGIITFSVGIFFGFAATYMFTFSSVTSVNRRVIVNSDGSILPAGPHSHGEFDHLQGPLRTVKWTDEHSHSHKEESDTVARELADKVRVLCWVMTNPSNHITKAKHVKATWGKRCNVLVFMSSMQDSSLPAIALPVSEGRESLWAKTKEAFKHIHENYLDQADWFMKADDDTYVVVENLRYFLSDKNPESGVYYGRRFKPYVKDGYMSGGAGYVLSKEALKRLYLGLDDSRKCRQDAGGAEDLELGKCLMNTDVHPEDSRDELQRERFHPFVPEHHLIPGILPNDMWYWSYNYYPAKQGPECCSDYAISFHYVPPNMMYVFEYLVYHLKPYGYNTVIKQNCPQNTSHPSDKLEAKVDNSKSPIMGGNSSKGQLQVPEQEDEDIEEDEDTVVELDGIDIDAEKEEKEANKMTGSRTFNQNNNPESKKLPFVKNANTDKKIMVTGNKNGKPNQNIKEIGQSIRKRQYVERDVGIGQSITNKQGREPKNIKVIQQSQVNELPNSKRR